MHETEGPRRVLKALTPDSGVTSKLAYSLTSSDSGHLKSTFPFSVNTNTGEVRTKRSLVHSEKAVWTLDLRARGTPFTASPLFCAMGQNSTLCT